MKIYKHFNANSLMTLFNGDCQKLLKEIPDETIDLIITSPPYCMKKAYEDPHADTETFKRLHEQIFDEIESIKSFVIADIVYRFHQLKQNILR